MCGSDSSACFAVSLIRFVFVVCGSKRINSVNGFASAIVSTFFTPASIFSASTTRVVQETQRKRVERILTALLSAPATTVNYPPDSLSGSPEFSLTAIELESVARLTEFLSASFLPPAPSKTENAINKIPKNCFLHIRFFLFVRSDDSL